MTSERPDPIEFVLFELTGGTDAPAGAGTGERVAATPAPGEAEPSPPGYLDLLNVWWDAPANFPSHLNVFERYSSLPDRCRRAVVAIGKFDGLHLGHRALIDTAATIADELGAPLGVLTFEPHPRAVFEPEAGPFRLMAPQARARWMDELGVDLLLTQKFDREFASLSPEDFVKEVLVRGMAVRHVVVGHDFRFGSKRGGDAAMLKALGEKHGFGVSVVGAVVVDGEVAGSTTVREHLRGGRPRAAARVLGRPWEVEGVLVAGPGGVPSLDLGAHVAPAPGWYGVRVADATAREEPAWHSVHARVSDAGNGRATLALTDLPQSVAKALAGRPVRVAVVDFVWAEGEAEPEL
ncbi:MAG: adenylyltransferase/cytidyltransferase family protein [Alphaproteobacteria bacterium]